MKKFVKMFVALFAMLLIAGCLSVDIQTTAEYEPTVDIPKYNKASEVPYEYTVFGVCSVEGNYQDYSLDDLYRKALIEGEKHGADAILIKSIRVIPHGRSVEFNPTLNIIGATEGGNNLDWEEINKDFDGGYGSIRNRNIGTIPNYDRIIQAEFIKFTLDDNGEFVNKKNQKDIDGEVVK